MNTAIAISLLTFQAFRFWKGVVHEYFNHDAGQADIHSFSYEVIPKAGFHNETGSHHVQEL